MSNDPVRCVDRKPKKAGEYNVSIVGVRTIMPIFAKFDGTEWNFEQPRMYDFGDDTMYWYPGEGE